MTFSSAVLFELLIEIGIGKAALGPMLLDDNVALPGARSPDAIHRPGFPWQKSAVYPRRSGWSLGVSTQRNHPAPSDDDAAR